jgi:hypothetical protein
MDAKEIPWIEGIVRFLDDNENTADFKGQFLWNPASETVVLLEGEEVRMFPEDRLFEVLVKKEAFEKLLLEAFSVVGGGLEGYS